jgi:predicted phosphate transport protein (TIGR00153 family)
MGNFFSKIPKIFPDLAPRRKKEFVNLLQQLIQKAEDAVSMLKNGSGENPSDLSKKIDKKESEADFIKNQLDRILDKSPIPPFEDRDDLYLLVKNDDDIIDDINKAAERLDICSCALPEKKEIKDFIIILENAVSRVKKGIECLKNLKKNNETLKNICIELRNLEYQGDKIYKDLSKKLKQKSEESKLAFKKEKSMAKFFEYMTSLEERWEMAMFLEHLEDALNQCEDCADFLDRIRKKNC